MHFLKITWQLSPITMLFYNVPLPFSPSINGFYFSASLSLVRLCNCFGQCNVVEMLLVWQFLLPFSWNKCSPWNPVTILWDTRYRGLMFRHSITIPASSQHLLPTMWLSYLVKYPDNYPSCHLISHTRDLTRNTCRTQQLTEPWDKLC